MTSTIEAERLAGALDSQESQQSRDVFKTIVLGGRAADDFLGLQKLTSRLGLKNGSTDERERHRRADVLIQARDILSKLGIKPFFEIGEVTGALNTKPGFDCRITDSIGTKVDGSEGVVGISIIIREGPQAPQPASV